MLVPNKNPPVYKEHIIYFIGSAFGEGFTIIDWLANMKLYVSDIVEPYKDSIIGCLGNSGTAYLLLHILQSRIECAVEERNWLYLWFCNVQALCINLIHVFEISQSN